MSYLCNFYSHYVYDVLYLYYIQFLNILRIIVLNTFNLILAQKRLFYVKIPIELKISLKLYERDNTAVFKLYGVEK
jgi:hypothetical protein